MNDRMYEYDDKEAFNKRLFTRRTLTLAQYNNQERRVDYTQKDPDAYFYDYYTNVIHLDDRLAYIEFMDYHTLPG